MTTNKPEVVGYLVEITNDPDIGAFFVDHEPSLKGCVNTPLILLSDYEALQAENEKLRAAMIEAKGHISHYMYGGSSYREPAVAAIKLIDDALQEANP